MPKTSSYLKWCTVYLHTDQCWWVKETSDPIHWDVDALSILDPKQVSHVLDLMAPLRDYKLQPELFELAFYPFSIQDQLEANCIKLELSSENLTHSDEMLFGLPDIIDEEKSPYADFLNHITKLRVKLLNDLIDFKSPLTLEEVEEELRERQNNDFMEGRCTHVFNEICDILEYVPHGYELDMSEMEKDTEDEDLNIQDADLPDLDEDDQIEQDETMKWDDERDDQPQEEAEADFENTSKKSSTKKEATKKKTKQKKK